jgi:hypothetical protein
MPIMRETIFGTGHGSKPRVRRRGMREGVRAYYRRSPVVGFAEASATRMCRLPSSRGEAYDDGMRIFLAGASGVIGLG